jgi:hypothetical protein
LYFWFAELGNNFATPPFLSLFGQLTRSTDERTSSPDFYRMHIFFANLQSAVITMDCMMIPVLLTIDEINVLPSWYIRRHPTVRKALLFRERSENARIDFDIAGMRSRAFPDRQIAFRRTDQD